MSKEAPDCLIDIWVQGDKAHIDRNFNPIIEGQRSHVRLRFHFISGWDERPCRMVTLINAARMYTTEMHFDELLVPIHMLREGDLRFIVRGFGLDTGANIVLRRNHFYMTDEIIEDDILCSAYHTPNKRFVLSDEKVGDVVVAKGSTAENFVITNETLSKTTLDVKPMTEDPNGYIEINNLDDPICVTGGKYVSMWRR